MPFSRRAVVAVVLGALAVLVALLAGLSIADPFHLRYARWLSAALVFGAILLVTLAFAAVTRRFLRWFVLVLGAVALLGWAGLVWFATGFERPSVEVSTVADGRRRLVVLQDRAPRPVHAVVLRSGVGPFEQESLVYQGVAGDAPPSQVRFVDPDDVEVRTARGCDYRSRVEHATLEIEPVHRPLQLGVC